MNFQHFLSVWKWTWKYLSTEFCYFYALVQNLRWMTRPRTHLGSLPENALGYGFLRSLKIATSIHSKVFRELLIASPNLLSAVGKLSAPLTFIYTEHVQSHKTPTSKFHRTHTSAQQLLHANCTSCALQLCSAPYIQGCCRCNSPS